MELDGIAIKLLRPSWLQDTVALINWQPRFFHGTILDNILCGMENAGMQRVVDVAVEAGVHEIVASSLSYPQKYHTPMVCAVLGINNPPRHRWTGISTAC